LAAAATVAYKTWRKDRITQENAPDDEIAVIPKPESLSTFSLEDAKERNRETLEAKINALNPYELQDMVAALLRAMGYHVPYVAKPGRDRGLDIIAYRDPLGAVSPRIKVQVKHSGQIGRPEIEKFVGAIRGNDIGIYVSSGGFSPEARSEARTHRTHDLTLIDGQELIALWTRYYGAIEERDRNVLPLEAVYFLSDR
jgi:restriction system protein